MSETICATKEPRRATRLETGGRGRATAFILLFVLSVGLVVVIETSTWRRLDQLKSEFAGANLEGFYLGLHLREAVTSMNGAVFRYQLSNDYLERDRFHKEAQEVRERINRTRAQLTTEVERRLVEEIQTAHERYQIEMRTMLEQGVRGIRRDTAGQVHAQILGKSEGLLSLAHQLVEAQRAALDRYFGSSGAVLGTLQELLLISGILLLALIASIATVMYRTLIRPLQARLHQSQAIIERQEKLASLGVLAAGVAHEVRNPLTAIKFRLFSLKNALPDGYTDHEDLTVIGSEISRLERIVKDFLQFARPTEPERASIPVGPLLREVHDLLKPELEKRSIQLKLDAVDSATARGDRQQIQQVLINLIQNAADSIDRAGVITLRGRQGAASLAHSPQGVVTLEVSDNGRGIPPEVEKRIFDPFFSTKEGGTGLGLAIAARIVEKHDGFIQYSTQLNRGTTFSVVLPKAASDESPNSADRR